METEEKNAALQEEFLPCMCDTFPDKFRLKAEEDLHETKSNVEKGLEVLRECIKREKLNFRTDENFLLPYLRQSKFNFKKAEERLKRSTKLYSKLEELIESTTIEKIQAVIDNDLFGVLPFRDGEGRLIVYGHGHAWRKDLFDLNDAVATLVCILFFFSDYPLTSVCGMTYLIDARLDSFSDLFPIINAYRTFIPYLNMSHFRIQRVDVINEYTICHYFYTVLRPILPSKIKNRVFFYGSDHESLKKVYPASILPSDFGITMEPLSVCCYRDQILEFANKLISEVKQKKKMSVMTANGK